MAIARPNTSRSQPLACDIGVRKKPSVARGPKLRREIRQPHSTITAGVRQPSVERREVVCDEIAMSANPSAPESRSLRMKLPKTESESPAACWARSIQALCRPRRRFVPAKTPILYVGCLYVVARYAPTEIAVRSHPRTHGRAACARDWKAGKAGAT